MSLCRLQEVHMVDTSPFGKEQPSCYIIPSCAWWKIRGSFPEESGNHVPFCEGEKD